MSEFKTKSITTKGMELLSKALSGDKLEFTRIEMGGGTCEGDIGGVEKLVNVKQNLPITKLTRKGSQVTVSGVLKIEDITSDYEWTEVGVYAKGVDNKEVLYFYAYTTNSSFISRDSLSEKLINITMMVSNAKEVTATVDSSLVYLTAEALEEHGKDEEAHQDIRELIEAEVSHLKESVSSIDLSSINNHTTTAINTQTTELREAIEQAEQNILSALGNIKASPIRSIQRGTVVMNNSTLPRIITFSEVDVNKSILLINGSIHSRPGGSESEHTLDVYVEEMTSTTATLNISRASSYVNNSTLSWQLIEFN